MENDGKTFLSAFLGKMLKIDDNEKIMKLLGGR